MKNRKRFLILFIVIIILIFFISCIKNHFERTVKMKVVWGWETEYTYFDRNLTLKDFEDFDYDTTYEDVVKQLGEPNGACVTNSKGYPYYELKNGKFVLFSYVAPYKIESISLCTDKARRIFLLPSRLLEMTEEEKSIELEHAQSLEMNAVLWMMEVQEWKRPSYNDEKADDPLGKYSEELLMEYTSKDYKVNISYYFGTYGQSGLQQLFQILESNENSKESKFVFIEWYGKLISNEGNYSLNGQEEILNIRSEDTDLSAIELTRAKLSQSVTAFLLDRKEIRKGLDAWVEFWGVDENGRYVFLFVTSPVKRNWGFDIPNNLCSYYYVTMDTKDNKVETIQAKLLKRIE